MSDCMALACTNKATHKRLVGDKNIPVKECEEHTDETGEPIQDDA